MINNSRRILKHTIPYVSLLLILSTRVAAQPGSNGSGPPGTPPQFTTFSPSMAIIIVILVAALFLMGFFSIYIRHCSDSAPGSGSVRALGASLRRRVASRGLDAAVIATFPTFTYSTVKGLKIGKGALECAVCLNEFEDDETLKLIPKCDHVFHPECVDAWLESHVTCPVCRANLVPQPGETLQIPNWNPESNEFPLTETANTQNDDVLIRVADDENQHVTGTDNSPSPQVVDRNQSVNRNRPPRSKSVRTRMFPKFPRSHSTGHSLVQPGENTDRFTLRLPEDVRKRMVTRAALNRTTSCGVVLPREGSSRRGYRTEVGEASNTNSRGVGSFSFRRLDRVLKSDRWNFSMAPPFISRSTSVRSPKVMSDNGEGSVSSSKGTKAAVKLASFKCLDPKSDESGLISGDSVRPPV